MERIDPSGRYDVEARQREALEAYKDEVARNFHTFPFFLPDPSPTEPVLKSRVAASWVSNHGNEMKLGPFATNPMDEMDLLIKDFLLYGRIVGTRLSNEPPEYIDLPGADIWYR